MPNATDLEKMAQSRDVNLPEAQELQGIPKPRLGYIGQIGENIDYDMIRAIAQAHPEWSLVFVGPIWANKEAEVADLSLLPNVRFLGGRPHRQLPGFLRGFDVCLMPHLRNPLTISMDPTKLYDYLASGKPIVSTTIAGVERFPDSLYLGDTSAEFVAGVEAALRENGGKIQLRLEQARQNSWPERAAEMWAIVQQLALAH
jgi:glycosyltransferase involved in cell wall biosynthesis